MCGIAGFVRRNRGDDVELVVRRMTNAIAHRGPDGEGIFVTTTVDGRNVVALGHRRLSIIDLAGGSQPITNEDGTIHIVFNGEIYNFVELRRQLIAFGHRFSTASDTEVIVHAYEQYGDACVEHLRGMFAFALWDNKRERLLLARDRFGKKPLFVAETDGALVFGSEIKALLRFPQLRCKVDAHAVWDYLAYRYVPGPRTLFEGIRKVNPGAIAIWERGRFCEHRYYVPPDGREPSFRKVHDPVLEFFNRLDDAVRIRMISDVPFGAFLSGGIDSSAIVCLMARNSSSRPIQTFSIGFAESDYSELSYASKVASFFGTEHHELVVRHDQFIEYLPTLIRYRDAPISEPSDIPIYLLSRAASGHVKMVLTGEGSDEILAGYPKHRFERLFSWYQKIPKWVRHGLLQPVVNSLSYDFRRAKTAFRTLELSNDSDRYARWFGALSPSERMQLATFEFHRADASPIDNEVKVNNTALRRILYFDQTSWLPDNLLERGDRMTMAASIEARMPFLDHKLVEFVSSLPDRYRLGFVKDKRILREAMRQFLPPSVLTRRKVGFRVPVNEWFRGSMRDYLVECLCSNSSLTREYYRPDVLARLVSEHIQGRENHEKLLWALLNLELWHREYFGKSEISDSNCSGAPVLLNAVST